MGLEAQFWVFLRVADFTIAFKATPKIYSKCFSNFVTAFEKRTIRIDIIWELSASSSTTWDSLLYISRGVRC